MSANDRQTRREYLRRTGIAGVIGASGLAGCIGGDEQPEEPEEPQEDGNESTDDGNETTDDDGEDQDSQEGAIQMGSILPITGELEAYGEGMQAGVELAVEHINAAGGPLDREIEVHTRDSETRPEAAVDRYESLVSDQGIIGFVGAASSGVSVPLAERVAEDEVMQVSNASTSPVLAELGYDNGTKFFGRTSPNDAQQGIVMGQILDEYVEAETSAWLYVDNPYGEGLAETGSEAFSGETLTMVGYDPDAADYTSTLDQVFEDDPDAVGFVGYPGNGVTIFQQWDEGGYGGDWVLSEGVNNASDFFEPLGEIVEGMYVASPHPEETDGAEVYQEAIGEADTLFAPHAYDGMFLQALAMEAAGEASGRAIAENIQSISRPEGETVTVDEFEEAKELLADGEEINYEGASSPVDMNDNLEALNQFGIFQVQDSQAELQETIPREEFEGLLD